MEMLPAIIKRRKKMADDDTEMPPPPKTAVVKRPRTPMEDEAYANGQAYVAQLKAERDQAFADRDQATAREQAAMKLVTDASAAMKRLEADRVAYQIERDEAVTRAAKLEERIAAATLVLISNQTPVRERIAPDAESSMPSPDFSSSPRPPSHEEMIARINGK